MLKDKLKTLRKKKNATQNELADFLIVSRTLVAKWENGKRYPTRETLELIAKFYDITYDELVKEDEEIISSQDELSECIPEKSLTAEDEFPNDVLIALLSKKISEFLTTLSKDERVVFMRRYYFYDKPDDISKKFDKSPEEVKAILSEVRMKLLDMLVKEGF